MRTGQPLARCGDNLGEEPSLTPVLEPPKFYDVLYWASTYDLIFFFLRGFCGFQKKFENLWSSSFYHLGKLRPRQREEVT